MNGHELSRDGDVEDQQTDQERHPRARGNTRLDALRQRERQHTREEARPVLRQAQAARTRNHRLHEPGHHREGVAEPADEERRPPPREPEEERQHDVVLQLVRQAPQRGQHGRTARQVLHQQQVRDDVLPRPQRRRDFPGDARHVEQQDGHDAQHAQRVDAKSAERRSSRTSPHRCSATAPATASAPGSCERRTPGRQAGRGASPTGAAARGCAARRSRRRDRRGPGQRRARAGRRGWAVPWRSSPGGRARAGSHRLRSGRNRVARQRRLREFTHRAHGTTIFVGRSISVSRAR